MIKREAGRWVVRSSKGKKLGTHSSKKKALAQLRAVEASKSRKRKTGHY